MKSVVKGGAARGRLCCFGGVGRSDATDKHALDRYEVLLPLDGALVAGALAGGAAAGAAAGVVLVLAAAGVLPEAAGVVALAAAPAFGVLP